MDAREIRARQIVAAGKITRGNGCDHVASQTAKGRYTVVPDGMFPSCTCDDFELMGKPCKHLIAVRLWLEAENKPAPEPQPIPKIKRKNLQARLEKL